MEISHIIHISDIHIRYGDNDKSRYNEYKEIFDNFLTSIQKLDCVKNNSSLIVITGDLFHNKGKLDTPAAKLYFNWFNKLLQLSDVVIICGNHDFRQEDPDHPDMIDVMTKPFSENLSYPHKVYYLKNSGIYNIYNIQFGVLSIKDVLRKFNTSGIIDNDTLPNFPSPDKKMYNIRIALFHGLNYHPEWFTDYNFVLLGDNHKQQISRSNSQYLAYAGSLIQQDFGESINKHGYILLDLHNNTYETVDINNNYAMIIIKKEKDEFVITNYDNKKNVNINLSDLQCEDIPKYPRIKYLGNLEDEAELIKILKKMDIQYKEISTVIPYTYQINDNLIPENNQIIPNTSQISDLNHSDKWITYLSSVGLDDPVIINWINNPELIKLNLDNDNIPDDINKRIIERISKLDTFLEEYKQSLAVINKSGKYKIVLQHMTWDYILCYGANNYFDFNKLEGKIVLLNGRNASGKSAFLDTLCIGLYGEPSKQRNIQNKKLSGKMIHDQRPKDNSMKVNILFNCDDILYEIKRIFGLQDTWARSINASIYKIDSDNTTKTLICEGTTMVNHWINIHFGTIDEILMSSIISQIDINNFFYMKSEDQKLILDKSLNLETIGVFGKYLHESILAHNDIIQSLSTVINTIKGIIQTKPKITISKDKIDTLEKEIESKNKLLNDKRNELEQLLSIIGNDFAIKNINSDITQLEKEVKSINKKINDINITDDNKEKMLSIIAVKESQLLELKAKYDELSNSNSNNCVINNENLTLQEYRDVLTEKLNFIKIEYSKNYITKKEKEWNDWIKIQKKEWIDNIDELLNYKEDCSNNLKDLTDKLAKTSLETNKKYVTLNDKYNSLMQNSVHLIMSEKEMIEWEKKYLKWKTLVNDVYNNTNSSDDLKSQYDKYEEFIKNYNTKKDKNDVLLRDFGIINNELKQIEDIPYNSECWACNKQPMQLRKKQLHDNFDKIKTSLDKIKKFLEKNNNIEKIKLDMEKIYDLYKKSKYFEDTKDFYIENQNKYIEAKEIIIKYNEWLASVNETKNNRDLYKKSLVDTRILIQNDINNLTKEITEMSSFINESATFIDLKKTIDIEKDKHTAFDDIQSQLVSVDNELMKIDLLNNIKDIETDELKKYIEFRNLINSKNNLEKNIAYVKSRNLKNEIVELDIQVQDYISEYGIVKKFAINSDDHQSKCDNYEDILNKLKIKKEKLLLLENKFVGNTKVVDDDSNSSYKEWIYVNHVIPLLQTEVNKFLEPIENIRLKIAYNGKSLVHFIYDRGNLPTLDMSSGYQKFIIAIALRLALARIGSIGQNIRHIYIDEGFTACDSINIEKSSLILKNIMNYGQYHSIILMSHLDIIRDIADIRVDINRGSSDIFSEIKWGSEYPKYNKVKNENDTIKKRGRPSKK